MMKDLNTFKNQIIYDNSVNNLGTLHYSFINIISFDEYEKNKNYIESN